MAQCGRCQICRREGHVDRECVGTICESCGKSGHYTRDCPKPSRPSKEARDAVEGRTHNATHVKEDFQDVDRAAAYFAILEAEDEERDGGVRLPV